MRNFYTDNLVSEISKVISDEIFEYKCLHHANRLFEGVDDSVEGLPMPTNRRCSGNKLLDSLKSATIERQVEDAYNEEFYKFFKGARITYPYNCDGFLETTVEGSKLGLIIEYKYDFNFKSARDRAKVLCQVVYYLKRFERDGVQYPNVCFVGDKNECFVLHTNGLLKYLDFDVDWSIAPSMAGDAAVNPKLVNALQSDEEINNPFIFDVKTGFTFCDIDQVIYNYNCNVTRMLNITEHNIARIYEAFCTQVLREKITDNNAHEFVGLFIGCLTDPDNYYAHPNQKYLVGMYGRDKDGKPLYRNYQINYKAYKAFFGQYSNKYSPSEKAKFTQIFDRLVDDSQRRTHGDFFTPTQWVDYAHERISDTLGADWKDEYVVWDCAWGTGNLTRDYKFKELYASTLVQSELDVAQKYNPEAEKFQFDFLNDFIPTGDELFGQEECKLPDGLLDAFEQNKKIVFFINPPYATAANWDESSKQGVAQTYANKQMLKDGYGSCSQNLYAQFLYRIEKIKQNYDLNNCYICIFCPTLFMSGSSYKNFRKYFLNDFKYIDGFQFKASHFADVSSNWGIGFTIWKSGMGDNVQNFTLDACDNYGNDIKAYDTKQLYNVDNTITASMWAKEPIKNFKTFDEPNVSSAIKIRDLKTSSLGKNFEGNMGYFLNAGNNVDKNTQQVGLFTTAYGNGHGHGINEDNFTRCTALFAARKLITADWINSKDEYLAPDESHPHFQEFVNDSIIYSLFHSASNQSSLRQVDYKDKQWDIKNEFFWMTRSEIFDLADETGNQDAYYDAKASSERYVSKLLEDGLYDELSQEARAVLDAAVKLTEDSFQYREDFDIDHPEYQINNWDCGYYQQKALWKEYLPEQFNEFKTLFKALADKMRPMVYEVGFLRK